MDKASDFGSEDCEFESRRGRCFLGNFVAFCVETGFSGESLVALYYVALANTQLSSSLP